MIDSGLVPIGGGGTVSADTGNTVNNAVGDGNIYGAPISSIDCYSGDVPANFTEGIIAAVATIATVGNLLKYTPTVNQNLIQIELTLYNAGFSDVNGVQLEIDGGVYTSVNTVTVPTLTSSEYTFIFSGEALVQSTAYDVGVVTPDASLAYYRSGVADTTTFTNSTVTNDASGIVTYEVPVNGVLDVTTYSESDGSVLKVIASEQGANTFTEYTTIAAMLIANPTWALCVPDPIVLVDGDYGDISIANTGTEISVDDDVIDYVKLGVEFKDILVLPALVVDWSVAGVFTKVLPIATSLSFSNLTIGTKIIQTTGDYSLTLPVGFVWAGGTRSTAGTTFYVVTCTDTATPIGFYSILKEEV